MAQYRTEVIIAADRYVCLQLPAHLPTGRATVTVLVVSSDESEAVESDPETEIKAESVADVEPDHQDIEWWDEFDEERERVG